MQLTLLVSLLLLTPMSLQLDLDASTTTGLARLLGIIIAIRIVIIVVVLAMPRRRRPLLARGRELLARRSRRGRGLQSPRRLTLLLGGNIATELLWAVSIGLFALAFGYRIGIAELLVINLSVALLSGVIPIPGGIGVVEGGLTFGLVRVGDAGEKPRSRRSSCTGSPLRTFPRSGATSRCGGWSGTSTSERAPVTGRSGSARRAGDDDRARRIAHQVVGYRSEQRRA